MTLVNVIDALDGNTLLVTPSWRSGDVSGNLVRIYGMNAPGISTREGQLARCRLCLLLAGSTVMIVNIYPLEGVILPCDVLFRGVPVWMHFPDYAAEGKGRRSEHREAADIPIEMLDIPIEMNTPRRL